MITLSRIASSLRKHISLPGRRLHTLKACPAGVSVPHYCREIHLITAYGDVNITPASPATNSLFPSAETKVYSNLGKGSSTGVHSTPSADWSAVPPPPTTRNIRPVQAMLSRLFSVLEFLCVHEIPSFDVMMAPWPPTATNMPFPHSTSAVEPSPLRFVSVHAFPSAEVMRLP